MEDGSGRGGGEKRLLPFIRPFSIFEGGGGVGSGRDGITHRLGAAARRLTVST